MPDYISRDTASERLHKMAVNFYSVYEKDGKDERLAALLELDLASRRVINAIPAADVAEVVRCEDCRHSYLEPYAAGIAHRICAYGMGADCEVKDDFYCAFGVKTDESEDEVIHDEIHTETAPADR